MKKRKTNYFLVSKMGVHFEWVGGSTGYLWIGTSPNDHVMTISGKGTLRKIGKMLLIRTHNTKKRGRPAAV